MEDKLNSYLFRGAEEPVKKLTLAIKEAIKETRFEGHVYMSGGTVRNLILGKPNDGTYELSIEKQGGGVTFAKWLTKKINKKITSQNPVINEDWGIGCFSLGIDDDCSEITVEASQTMKMWPENTTTPINLLFGTLLEDALSRDYTINTLYYDISDDRIIDKTGRGIMDIAEKVLRTPTNPGYAFRCSPVRLLRGLRMVAEYDFSFEKKTWLAFIQKAPLINLCEAPDIKREMTKIMISDKPSRALKKMRMGGLLKHLFPDVYELKGVMESHVDKIDYLDHTFKVVDATFPLIENRLAALMHEVGIVMESPKINETDEFSAECAKEVLSEIGYSKSVCENIATAIRYHRYFSMYGDNVIPNGRRIKKFMELCGQEYPLALDLMSAENNCSAVDRKPRQVLNILKRIEAINEREKKAEKPEEQPPVNGDDIMQYLEIKKGPIVGFVMKHVKHKFKAQDITTKDECLEYAKQVYESYKDKV